MGIASTPNWNWSISGSGRAAWDRETRVPETLSPARRRFSAPGAVSPDLPGTIAAGVDRSTGSGPPGVGSEGPPRSRTDRGI